MPYPFNPYGINIPTFGRGGSTPTTPTLGNLPNYSVSPLPFEGQGPYGKVPGTTAVPPSIFQQTLSADPGLGQATTQATNVINSQLSGELDPQTIKNMQDVAAQYGLSSGMPGSNAIPGTLAFNANLRNIGLDTQQLQQQGIQNYLSQLGAVGGQQLNPSLLTQLSEANAQLLAAPDPAQAAQLQMQLYQNALSNARGPAGGTGYQSIISPSGGTGVPFVPGFGAGGVPNPTTTGGTAYASSIPNPYGDQSGTLTTDWQTGLPLPNTGTTDLTDWQAGLPYTGPTLGLPSDGTDLSSEDWSQIFANPGDYYPLGG
jgi:hypothetical protein